MIYIKRLIVKTFNSLAFFYSYLGIKIFALLSVTIFVGLLDGLGLSMFLPLFQIISEDGVVSPGKMGKLHVILDFLNSIGLSLNLTVVLLTMLFFFTFKGIATYINNYLRVVYQQYFIAKIRKINISALANYRYDKFVQSDFGEIQNTLTGEVHRVIRSYDTYIGMLQQCILVFTYSALAIIVNYRFTVLMFLGGVLAHFIFNIFYKRTKQLSYRLVSQNNMFHNKLIQSISFFNYLKATGRIDSYATRLKKNVTDIEYTTRRMGIIDSIIKGIREPITISIIVVVILVHVRFTSGGLGTVLISLIIFYRALTAITAVQDNYNKFLGFSGSLNKMKDFINHLKDNKEKNGSLVIDGFKDNLVLNNLTFSYPNSSIILEGLNLTITKNKTLALVGESGSGKTTLINILSGLLKPTIGEFLIDGKNSQSIDIESYQKKIGYITQDPVIFNDTIYNNVTFWAKKTKQNIDLFWKVLHKAHIIDFVNQLNDKEEQLLGINGINLSGGQKQRISIARELFKKADILFLDEATSALDSKTEKEIQDNIFELQGKYTLIIIAHRLSTIKNSDKVLILNKGRIDKSGTYDELIQKSTFFKKMVELQEI